MRQHLARQPHQRIDLDLRRLARLRPQHRRKLQRAHAARAGVAKPLHRIETLRRPALRRQPGIDQRVAELVRQRIRQQPRQAVKACSAAAREIHTPARSTASSAAKARCRCAQTPGRIGTPPRPALRRATPRRWSGPKAAPSRSCRLTPGPFLRPSPAPPSCRWPAAASGLAASIAPSGSAAGSGTSVSKRSTKPSTRHTRTKPDNCVAAAPRFQPLHRPQAKTRLFRQLLLRQVARQPQTGQALADQLEQRLHPSIFRSIFIRV